MTVASLFAEIGVDTSPMTGVARDIESKLAPVQQTFRQVGTALTQYITVPLAGAAAAAVSTGTTIDNEFSRIEGLVGESREALRGMRSELLNISTATGEGPGQLAEALFFVESAGFRGSEAMSVLEASAKAAAGGLGRTKDVADAVTSAVNAYGQANLSASRATDVLTATVREGKLEATELAGSIGKVIPQASQMGVEFNEVGATLASLTRIGANTRRATTALNAVLTTINKGAQGTRDALDKMGFSLDGVRQVISQEGLLPALKMLQGGFQDTSVEMTDVFGNVRALRGVLGLLGKNAEEAEAIFQSMNNEVGGSTQAAFEAAQGTISNQFNRALREAQKLLDEIYVTFRGQIKTVLSTTISVLSSVADAFASLSETTQGVIVAAGALAAALGPVLVAMAAVISMGPALLTALSAIGTAVPYIAAVGAAALAVQQNWESLVAFFTTGAGASMFDALQAVAVQTKDVVVDLFADMKRAVGTLVDAFNDAVRGGGGLISLLGTSLADTFETLAQAAIPVLDFLGDSIGFVANSFARSVSFIVDLLTGDFAGAWATTKRQFSAWVDFLRGGLANVADLFLTFVESTVNILPGIEVELDAARKAVRRWGEAVGEEAKKAKATWKSVGPPVQDVWDLFEEGRKAANKAGNAAKAGGDKAKESWKSIAPPVQDVWDLFKKAGSAAQTAGSKTKTALDKAQSSISDLRAKLTRLSGPEGKRLARAQKTKEELQKQVDALKAANRIAVEREESGRQVSEVEGAGLEQPGGQQGEDSQQEGQGATFGGIATPIEQLPAKLDQMKKKGRELGIIWRKSVQMTRAAGDKMIQKMGKGFATLITKGKMFGKEIKSVGDAFKAMGNMAMQIIQQVIQKLIAAAVQALIFKALTGGAGGSFGSVMGSFLGGGGPSLSGSRAEGGPVSGGKSYLVGENEPEVFTPSRGGQVTPMSDFSGAQQASRVTVDIRGPDTLANGDIRFAAEESKRQQSRRGFPE